MLSNLIRRTLSRSRSGGRKLTRASQWLVARDAAVYMRWAETRYGRSPTPELVRKFVAASLDRQGFARSADDIIGIELLALALDVDMVEDFIKRSGSFEALDKIAGHSE